MQSLYDLNEDIIVAMLLCCDVFTILRVEQTCKYLRGFASSRHLWLTLVSGLDYDHAPVLLPHESLHYLPMERLREMAVRSARGYLNWTSSREPKVTRSTSLKLSEIKHRKIILGMLSPGGKYFVFLDGYGHLHCYDTESRVNICSHPGVPFDEEVIGCIDCIFDDDGATLIVAYVTFPETNLNERQEAALNVTVVRLELHSGASSTALSFLIASGELVSDGDGGIYSSFEDEIWKVRLTNETMATAISGSILVANWRTGMRAITREVGIIHSLEIAQNHVLCAIRKKTGDIVFSAAPLSLLFAGGHSSVIRQYDDSTLSLVVPTRIRSEDVFIYVSPIPTPGFINGEVVHSTIELVSVCTSSWKFPNLREPEALAASTQILLCLHLWTQHDDFYMLSQLEFSPTSNSQISSVSPTTLDRDNHAIEYKLTCQRQSQMYLYDDAHFPAKSNLTNATRTGRAIRSFAKFEWPTPGTGPIVTPLVFAIGMHGLMGSVVHEGYDIDSDLDKKAPEYRTICSNLFTQHDVQAGTLMELNVEEYSGALWYCRDMSLFIHYFD